MVPAVKSDSNRQRVYGTIKARVIAHEYEPGQRLMAEIIAEELEVGEMPVRESLLKLCGEGLIEIAGQVGFYVKPISGAEIRELYKFNLLLLEHSLGLNGTFSIPPYKFPDPIDVARETEPPPPPCARTIVRITDNFFTHIAGQSGNSQIVRNVWSINDQLHHVRIQECEVLNNPVNDVLELYRLYYQDSNDDLVAALRTYHTKRIYCLLDIMKAIGQ